MADITRNRIIPPEILMEIFMLTIHNLPQYELLACALVCTSWYYCAMEIIRPTLQKGIDCNTSNILQAFNTVCSYMQKPRLDIMHQVPIIHFNAGESTAMFENITRIWHSNCWAVIHIPSSKRDFELQRISNFLNSFKPRRRQQLTRLGLRIHRNPFPRSTIAVDTLIPIMRTFSNISEINLEWNSRFCRIFKIFPRSKNIRNVTITEHDPTGIEDLGTAINGWPLLQHFTLKYTGSQCSISPLIDRLAESCKDLSSLVILVNIIYRRDLETALVNLINVRGQTLTRFVLRDINIGCEVLYALSTLAPNLEELDISWDIGAMDYSIPCRLWSKIRLLRLDFPYGCIINDWLLGILTNCSGLQYDMLLSARIERDNRIMEALQSCTYKIINKDYWIPTTLHL